MDVDAVAELAVADLLHERGLDCLDGPAVEEAVEVLVEQLWEQTEVPARWESTVRAAIGRRAAE